MWIRAVLQSDKGFLYRSDRPKYARDLISAKIGHQIHALVTLEEGWSDVFGWNEERDLWEKTMGLPFYNFPMSNFWPPSKATCDAILDIFAQNAAQGRNTLIHCYSGVDRTGFVAAYALWKYKRETAEDAWDYAVKTGQHWWFRWWKKHFLKICGG